MSDLKITDRMLQNAKSNKCVGWLYLDPVQFLSLTVTDHNVYDWIEKELPHTKTIDEYNSYETLMPWLDVDMHTGKVLGHEGRHRAAACIKSGVKRLPVAICLRDHGYPVYYSQPFIDDYENPKQLQKVFVTKKDVPRVLVGQFVHRSLLIDPSKMHEFWASYNASTNIDADLVTAQISEIVHGVDRPGQFKPWETLARYIRNHSLTSGSVILFGSSPTFITHAVLLNADRSPILNENSPSGYYLPSESAFRVTETDALIPIVKQIPVASLLQPVEASLKLRALKTV